jgi:hypothetical protein
LLRNSYLNSELCKMRKILDDWNIYYYGDLMYKICAPIEVVNFSNLCEIKCFVTIWTQENIWSFIFCWKSLILQFQIHNFDSREFIINFVKKYVSKIMS